MIAQMHDKSRLKSCEWGRKEKFPKKGDRESCVISKSKNKNQENSRKREGSAMPRKPRLIIEDETAVSMPGMWNQIPLSFFDLITSCYNITIKIHPYKIAVPLSWCPGLHLTKTRQGTGTLCLLKDCLPETRQNRGRFSFSRDDDGKRRPSPNFDLGEVREKLRQLEFKRRKLNSAIQQTNFSYRIDFRGEPITLSEVLEVHKVLNERIGELHAQVVNSAYAEYHIPLKRDRQSSLIQVVLRFAG
jgi:hypothetical protein